MQQERVVESDETNETKEEDTALDLERSKDNNTQSPPPSTNRNSIPDEAVGMDNFLSVFAARRLPLLLESKIILCYRKTTASKGVMSSAYINKSFRPVMRHQTMSQVETFDDYFVKPVLVWVTAGVVVILQLIGSLALPVQIFLVQLFQISLFAAFSLLSVASSYTLDVVALMVLVALAVFGITYSCVMPQIKKFNTNMIQSSNNNQNINTSRNHSKSVGAEVEMNPMFK
jgi:hypothetical protein